MIRNPESIQSSESRRFLNTTYFVRGWNSSNHIPLSIHLVVDLTWNLSVIVSWTFRRLSETILSVLVPWDPLLRYRFWQPSEGVSDRDGDRNGSLVIKIRYTPSHMSFFYGKKGVSVYSVLLRRGKQSADLCHLPSGSRIPLVYVSDDPFKKRDYFSSPQIPLKEWRKEQNWYRNTPRLQISIPYIKLRHGPFGSVFFPSGLKSVGGRRFNWSTLWRRRL